SPTGVGRHPNETAHTEKAPCRHRLRRGGHVLFSPRPAADLGGEHFVTAHQRDDAGAAGGAAAVDHLRRLRAALGSGALRQVFLQQRHHFTIDGCHCAVFRRVRRLRLCPLPLQRGHGVAYAGGDVADAAGVVDPHPVVPGDPQHGPARYARRHDSHLYRFRHSLLYLAAQRLLPRDSRGSRTGGDDRRLQSFRTSVAYHPAPGGAGHRRRGYLRLPVVVERVSLCLRVHQVQRPDDSRRSASGVSRPVCQQIRPAVRRVTDLQPAADRHFRLFAALLRAGSYGRSGEGM
ncbi:uncharacterized protein METZ01_LOCUS232698, partial [marine metagenome]